MKFRFRHAILVGIVALSVWALIPPADDLTTQTATASPTTPASDTKVKYTLRVAPGLYLPDNQPSSVGKPLQQMRAVAREFEQLYPDTHIEFANVPSDMREWLVTQLSAGQGPDIFNINVEDVWQDVQKGWYVPLDPFLAQPNPFVKPGEPGSRHWFDQIKYPGITRGTMAPDGHMYCLTYDMIETGVFYNKTLFKQWGLGEPKDWNQFLALQQKIREHRKLPLAIVMWCLSDWAADLLFDQLYYPITPLIDLQCDPKRAEYLANYLDWDEIVYLHRKGFFTKDDPRWVDTFRVLKDWRRFMGRDLTNDDPIKMFMNQDAAMLWYTSEMVQKLTRDPDVKFEYGIFYLPPLTKSQSLYASGREMCVIGGSGMQYCISNSAIRDTGDTGTSERLKRCIAFLQYLTTPQNCERIVNEPICFLPNIKGAEPHTELLPFDEFLKRPYSCTKWYYTFDLKFDEVYLRTLELYLNDGMTEGEFLDAMDRNLTDAAENITRRKSLNFAEFDRIWAERKHFRETLPGIPEAAR